MKKSFLQTTVLFGIFFIFTFQFLTPGLVQAQSTYENFDSAPQQAETGQLSLVNTDSYNPFKLWWNNLPFVGKSDGLGNTVANGPLGWVADKTAQVTIMPLIQTGAVFFLKIIQFGMWIAGGIFDMIVFYTIEDQSLVTSLAQSIGSAWKIIRDLANIVIVFSLLYLGIKTILNGNGFAEGKVLMNILIAAVLINFSLVFTQAVFNVSNVVGAQIANQIVFSGQAAGYGGVHKISEGLMGMIRPDNIMAIMWNDKALAGWENVWDRVQVALITGTTMIFLMIIFIGASFLLMYRFIIFIVLMITSPVGLISKLVPMFNKSGEKWWSTLKSQAIVLPVFMLTLYISILFVAPFSRMLNPATSLVGSSLSTVGVPGASTSASAAGAVTFFFNYLLIIGFLLLPLIVPGKVGAAGSDMMTNVADWTTKKIKSLPRSSARFGGRMAVSGSARAGRYLVGNKFANALGGNTEEERKALRLKAQSGGWEGWKAQQRLKASESLKKQTFDVRNTKAGAKLGMGKGIESYTKAVKRKMDEFETKKKEEMKLFGFDKAHETDENRLELAKAQFKRTNAEGDYRSAEALYKANPNAVTLDDLKKAEKHLEEREKAVGKLKNIGESQYIEQDSNKWTTKLNNLSSTTKESARKIREESEKKWKEGGQSSNKKKDRAERARNERELSTPPSTGSPPTPPAGGTPPVPPTP